MLIETLLYIIFTVIVIIVTVTAIPDAVLHEPCLLIEFYLTIRLRARVFYEQIVNEEQPS